MAKSTKSDGSILSRSGLRLDRLQRIARRPALYAGRDRSFWTDPYVARHVLDAHLDPHTDDASRRPASIMGTVERVMEHADRGSEARPRALADRAPRLLDLGCGPGLYAEQFAARGFRVVGIDFSSVSLEHARTSAGKQGLEIDYREADVTRTRFDGPYDVVTMIYGEFCTLSERERRELLERVREALAPGGLFVFDVFTEAYVRRNRSSDEWYVSTRNGFWQSSPHLALLRHFHYPHESASVATYTIVNEDGSYRQFNVWWRHFTPGGIRGHVEAAGLEVEATYGSLWGEPYEEGGEWIGVYARKPAT